MIERKPSWHGKNTPTEEDIAHTTMMVLGAKNKATTKKDHSRLQTKLDALQNMYDEVATSDIAFSERFRQIIKLRIVFK